MDAIILAGGFGTRLQSVVNDVPKPMAPIGNKPFLKYLLDYLIEHQIQNVVLCTGYKHEVIENYFLNDYKSLSITYSVEQEPLGTGGAIKEALKYVSSEEVLILNGDTLFNVDLQTFRHQHKETDADISVALKYLVKFDRYGSVVLNKNKIVKFDEKKYMDEGYINGGIYILNSEILKNYDLPKSFSFEKEILESKVNELKVMGYKCNEYFIDIGIPEDYIKSQTEIKELFNE